jgi:hypothetical protein
MDSNNDNKTIKLNAKLSKFMLFGFWFLDSIKNDIDHALFASLLDKLKLYHNPSEQISFYQSFLDQSKTVNKNFKTFIKNQKKSNKITTKNNKKYNKKNNKPYDPISDLAHELIIASSSGEPTSGEPTVPPDAPSLGGEVVVESEVVAEVPTEVPTEVVTEKPKKARKSSKKVPEVVTEVPAEVPAEVVTEKPKKARKSSKKGAEVESQVESQVVSEVRTEIVVVEEKPKKSRKSSKKGAEVPAEVVPEVPAEVVPEVPPEVRTDDDIEVHEITIDGKTFLVDSNNNLFDFTSHSHIGSISYDNSILLF